MQNKRWYKILEMPTKTNSTNSQYINDQTELRGKDNSKTQHYWNNTKTVFHTKRAERCVVASLWILLSILFRRLSYNKAGNKGFKSSLSKLNIYPGISQNNFYVREMFGRTTPRYCKYLYCYEVAWFDLIIQCRAHFSFY